METSKIKFKSLFFSDIHLGSMKARSKEFIEFIHMYEFDNIFIVGDFIDIWQLKIKKYWPQEHTDVVRKILKRSKRTKIYYILGNHDDFLTNFTADAVEWGNIQIFDNYHYQSFNKNILIMHGHEFDNIVKYSKWIAKLGDYAYEMIIKLDKIINKVRHFFKMDTRFSLSHLIKQKVKQAVNFIYGFEESVSRHAKINKFDIVVCGHIHHPVYKNINNIDYYNCGDWVENLSFILEDYEGNLILCKYNSSSKTIEKI